MFYKNDVLINVGPVSLNAVLSIPNDCKLIVIFAIGSGKYSARCKSISNYFIQNNIGTLFFNLLTEKEDIRDKYLNFDIYLLTKRLIAATKWVQNFNNSINYPICYFAYHTGAAAAMEAAARLTEICGIVSRDGRPDMAGDSLSDVEAPSLLIVNSMDNDLIILNEKCINSLRCLKDLLLIDNENYLYHEIELNQLVAQKASLWFEKYALPILEY